MPQAVSTIATMAIWPGGQPWALSAAPTWADDAAATSARADFVGEPASPDARRIADWVVAVRDNAGLPFVIIDKVAAKVFVFDARGRLSGAAPALLGLTRGDDTASGVGQRKLANIGPNERTTPAGRFVASLGRDLGDKDVLWVDYSSGVALHRVITTNPREHRLQRLASPSPRDRRISYGCINVPAAFYDTVIDPAFAASNGVVYILPETRPIEQVFVGFDLPAGRHATPTSSAKAP